MTRLLPRLGLILASIAAALGATAFAAFRSFDRLVARDRGMLLGRPRSDGPRIATDEMLLDLPAPVQRYLRHAGVVGRPMVETVRIHQEGRMHPSADGPWLPISADQWYSVEPPGFVWSVTMRIGPLPVIRGRDRYLDGHGAMLIKAGALFPIVDATGPEMDQGALMRHLSEMPWFPSAFLRDRVTWEAIDDTSARVTLTDGDRSVSGVMSFDEDGRLTEFRAERYRMIGGGFELQTWSAPTLGYGEFEGLELPAKGAATWKAPDGDLTYIELELTEVAIGPGLTDVHRPSSPARTRHSRSGQATIASVPQWAARIETDDERTRWGPLVVA